MPARPRPSRRLALALALAACGDSGGSTAGASTSVTTATTTAENTTAPGTTQTSDEPTTGTAATGDATTDATTTGAPDTTTTDPGTTTGDTSTTSAAGTTDQTTGEQTTTGGTTGGGPVCGDGVVGPGETCDDASGVGCDTYHDGGDGACVPPGTCSPGHVLSGQECVLELWVDHVHIHVDNNCDMTIEPTSFAVQPGQKLRLDYHNHSVDYPVDVWMHYNGGFTDLPPGETWMEKYEHCFGPAPSEGWAEISTPCSQFVLPITCL